MAKKKRKKKRNPANQRMIDEAVAAERKLTTDYLAYKLITLDEIPGIGPTMRKRIKKHFGVDEN